MEDNISEIEPIPTRETTKQRLIITIVSIVLVVILAVASALLVKKYVISTFIVDGISMYPTLDGGNGAVAEISTEETRKNGEILYLNKVAKLKRGDIIVFAPEWPELVDSNGNYKSLVKRVIALSGDHLQILDNKVYLNGELLDEPYINEPMLYTPDIDIVVSENHIFCMGDNRNHSSDCRTFGEVSLDRVEGKCWLIKGLNGKLRKPN